MRKPEFSAAIARMLSSEMSPLLFVVVVMVVGDVVVVVVAVLEVVVADGDGGSD